MRFNEKINNELLKYSEVLAKKPKIIALNKCDLIKEQVVNEADAEKYADDHGMKIRFTSALNNPYGFKSYLNELIIDYINFDKNDDIKDKKKKEVVVLKTGNKENKNKNKKRKC